jgi:hypothetical protein
MTPEERELLTRSIKLSEENNRMLRGIRRNARISSFLRVVYWIIILGTAFGTYYYIQPYISAIMKGYTDMQKGVQNVTNITTNLPSMPSFPTLPSWLGGPSSTSTK